VTKVRFRRAKLVDERGESVGSLLRDFEIAAHPGEFQRELVDT
jgi:hypothetical protein